MDIDKTLREYSTHLRKFLAARMRNKSDVDDVHQEVLVKTFRHFRKLKKSEKFKSWFYRIARNTLVDYYRRSDKYPREEIFEIEDVQEKTNAAKRDLIQCLRPFLRNLPEKYRKPLEAAELGDASQKDLAKKMKLSYSGLKSRVQRGRQLLYQQYKQCCKYEFDVKGGVVSFEPKGYKMANCLCKS